MSAGTCRFLKACKKCTTTVFKMPCTSVWMCKKTNGKSASTWYIMEGVYVHLTMEHEHAEPCGSQSAQLKPHQG